MLSFGIEVLMCCFDAIGNNREEGVLQFGFLQESVGPYMQLRLFTYLKSSLSCLFDMLFPLRSLLLSLPPLLISSKVCFFKSLIVSSTVLFGVRTYLHHRIHFSTCCSFCLGKTLLLIQPCFLFPPHILGI